MERRPSRRIIMARNNVSNELDGLIDAALEKSIVPYIEGIASVIEGKPNSKAWHDFEVITTNAIFFALLAGIAEVLDTVDLEEVIGKVAYAKDEWDLETVDYFFEAAPFEEAINLFDERIPRLRQNLEPVLEIAKNKAKSITLNERQSVFDNSTDAVSEMLDKQFWVTGADDKQTIDLKELIANAMRGVSEDTPATLPAFLKEAMKTAPQLPAHRLSTVYRTNLSQAFNEGHMSSMRSPDVKQVAPLARLVEINDSRSREHHAAMNGYINTIEQFDALQLTPPNGYNCRGTVVVVSWPEAERLGIATDGIIDFKALESYNGERQGYIDRGEYPDPGFV